MESVLHFVETNHTRSIVLNMLSDRSILHVALLDGEKDEFKPYEKHHGTVKDSAELAQELQVKNLLLWHTEDKNIRKRKSLYKKEAKKYYKGNVYVHMTGRLSS